MSHRVLVLSHGHPDFSLGGGELAAYQLYQEIHNHPEVEAAWFLGARGSSSSGALKLRRPNEYTWEQKTSDVFLFKGDNLHSTMAVFRELIEHLKPTVVFAHHYFQLGLEYLRVLRDVNPSIHIVMTLHEMLAICRSDGQMVKPGTLKLCQRESPDECHRCFPEHSAESFWLRKRYVKNYFELVDHFVTPSEFLRQRYIDWGLAPNQITVIENGQADVERLAPRELKAGETRSRFAFFGQINRYKGVDVLLEALRLIPKEDMRRLSVEIHGANLEWQDDTFKKRIAQLSAPLEKLGCLRWVGPYSRADLSRRMAKIDWLLVPSVWWENSPMVIQEAFSLGRPVICSGIGGMAEKVRHNIDGWHVEPKNPHDLADTIVDLSKDTSLWDRLYAGLRRPMTYKDCAEEHLKIASMVTL